MLEVRPRYINLVRRVDHRLKLSDFDNRNCGPPKNIVMLGFTLLEAVETLPVGVATHRDTRIKFVVLFLNRLPETMTRAPIKTRMKSIM